VQLLGEMPKDTINGVGVGVRTHLQQLVVIDEVCFAHEKPLPDRQHRSSECGRNAVQPMQREYPSITDKAFAARKLQK
jgi:hypothetical protein